MRLAIYSDLHLEREAWAPPGRLDADAVVVAGDIGHGTAAHPSERDHPETV